MAELAQLTAAEKAGVDQYWVLRNLRRNAVLSMRHGDRSAAARSLELTGHHLGMFVDNRPRFCMPGGRRGGSLAVGNPSSALSWSDRSAAGRGV